ncbi:MAG TPA: glycosyltransferase family 39 protein, partial [Thermoanaerobaculia bacterium]|nr:glycosyltransferase family 39 protein [Thermoanaerobaculia bacterium]
MVRQDPITNAFVSVREPKPPLHIWLLALFLHAIPDPLRAGRLLSVAAGAATVLVIFPLCRLLAHLGDPASAQRGRKGAGYGATSAMLVATCPYLAFYDRLALADGLVVFAGVIVAWLSLRLARCAWEPPETESPAKVGLLLGLGLGLAMLT